MLMYYAAFVLHGGVLSQLGDISVPRLYAVEGRCTPVLPNLAQ